MRADCLQMGAINQRGNFKSSSCSPLPPHVATFSPYKNISGVEITVPTVELLQNCDTMGTGAAQHILQWH